MMRFGGLYKWWSPEASQLFVLGSAGAGLALYLVPFRLIFAGVVINFFTEDTEQRKRILKR
jgi:hypothetical protein